MNKLRISFSENHENIKGSIKLEGDTTFIMSCMASVVEHIAKAYDVPEHRVLEDIWKTIREERNDLQAKSGS